MTITTIASITIISYLLRLLLLRLLCFLLSYYCLLDTNGCHLRAEHKDRYASFRIDDKAASKLLEHYKDRFRV